MTAAASSGRNGVSRRAALIGLAATIAVIPASFAATGLVARVLVSPVPQRVATDFAQPLPVVTAWGGLGAALWALLAVAVLVSAASAFGAILLFLRKPISESEACVIIVVGALAAMCAMLTWPVVFSSDVYAYAAYGAAALDGMNPYVRLPATSDPLVRAAAWQWQGQIPACVYGEGFLLPARMVVAALRAFGPAPTLLAFRIGACSAFVVAVVALRTILGPNRLGAVVAVALNPVALWSAAEGHNDAAMVAAALCGVALAVRGKSTVGGALVAFSSLIKAPGAVIGAALAAMTVPLDRARVRRFAWAGAVAFLAVLAVSLPQLSADTADLRRHGHYTPEISLQAFGFSGAQLIAGERAGVVGTLLAGVFAAAIVLYGCRRLARKDVQGMGWLAVGVWLLIPSPYPWYAMWFLPLSAVLLEKPVGVALWWLSIAVILRYLPDAFGSLPLEAGFVMSLVALTPLLYALRPSGTARIAAEPLAS
ncbi:MAG: hypothetical protein JO043_13285 [Candidatus Eremiobacteraeota bacterium]|nr:hypothetical protein [Candidatus Eremiobacteraeota bacterium]